MHMIQEDLGEHILNSFKASRLPSLMSAFQKSNDMRYYYYYSYLFPDYNTIKK